MKRFARRLLAFVCAFCLMTESLGGALAYGDTLDTGAWSNGSNGSGTWTVYEDGTLVLSGTGKIKDFSSGKWVADTPWFNYIQGKTSGGTTRSVVTTIVIENGITRIGENAFTRTYSLERLDASGCATLEVIGPSAFKQSSGSSGPNNTNSPREIDFSGCVKLSTIGSNAFQQCSGVTYLDISDTKLNGVSAFDASKTKLQTLKANRCDSITTLNLSGHTKLTTLELSDCANLTSLTLPNSVTSLKLDGCAKLTSLTAPTSAAALDLGGSSLVSLTIPSGANLGDVSLPSTISTVTGLENLVGARTIRFDGTMSEWLAKGIAVPEGVTVIPNAVETSAELNGFLAGGGYTIGGGAEAALSAPALLSADDEALTLRLHFAEVPGAKQFDSADTLYYALPTNLTLAGAYADSVSVTVDETPLTGAVSYQDAERRLTVSWDGLSEQQRDALFACDSLAFDLTLPVTVALSGGAASVELGGGHTLVAGMPRDPYVASVTGVYGDGVIVYTAALSANGDVDVPVTVDFIGGTALGAPFSGSYRVNGGDAVSFSFPLVLSQLHDGDAVTLTCSVGVDPEKVALLGAPTKAETGGTFTLTNSANPYNLTANDSLSCESELSLPTDLTISGETSGRGLDAEYPYQDVTWTVVSNATGSLTQAGTISGVLDYDRNVFVKEPSGTVGSVTVIDRASGSAVASLPLTGDALAWSSHTGDPTNKFSTWSWTIPEAYQGTSHTVELRITTRFRIESLNDDEAVPARNTVTAHTGGAYATAEIARPVGSFSAEQEVVSVSETEVTWRIATQRNAMGHTSYTIRDVLPALRSWKDSPQPLSVTVTGLTEGESYELVETPGNAWENARLEIVFYKDAERTIPGLNPLPGEMEDTYPLTVTLTTTNDPGWIDAEGLTVGEKIHTNRAEVRANGYCYAEAEAMATPQKPCLVLTNRAESGVQFAETELDGVSCPVFAFALAVGGLTDDMLDDGKLVLTEALAADAEQARLWKLYDGDDAAFAARAYRTSTGYAPDTAGYPAEEIDSGFTAACENGAATFTLAPTPRGGGYWDYYQIVYYVVPRDASALRALKLLSVRTGAGDTVGEQRFTARASAASMSAPLTADADYIFSYLPVQKRLTAMDGNWAYYRVDANPDAFELNDDAPVTLRDTFHFDEGTDEYAEIIAAHPDYVKQSIDYSSVRVFVCGGESETELTGSAFAAAGVSYDYSGYTGTFLLPDARHIAITYRTRVSGEAGSTVTFQNTAELVANGATYPVTAGDRRLLYPGSDDLTGSAGDYGIRLFKYAAGHMETGLAGARFQLRDANRKVVYGKDGEPVVFVTGADGYADVRTSEAVHGFTLRKNTVYYLEEVEAPVGTDAEGRSEYYRKDNTLYSFLISDNPNYEAGGAYVFYSNDVLKVKNWPEEPGVFISVRFSGNVSLTAEQKRQHTFLLERRSGESWTAVDSVQYDPSTDSASPFRYGYYRFRNAELTVGSTYRVREDNSSFAPESGALTAREWILTTVDGDGKLLTTDALNRGEDGWNDACEFVVDEYNREHCIDVLCVNEYIEHKLSVKKVDRDDGAGLGGAVFTVCDESDHTIRTYSTAFGEIGSEALGTFEVRMSDDVRYGYDTLYYIVETKAPTNYLLPEQPERVYFYFSQNGGTLTAPDGSDAVDLSRDYASVVLENRRSALTIPVRVTWSISGDASWPENVDHVVIGLFRSVNGSEDEPVYGDGGQQLAAHLTKDRPFDNTTFVNLAAEDAFGSRFDYVIRELHVYADAAETTDRMDEFAPSTHITDAEIRVVTNRRGCVVRIVKQWYEEGSGRLITDRDILAERPAVSFDLFRTTLPLTFGEDPLTRAELNEQLAARNAEPVRVGLSLSRLQDWRSSIGSLEAESMDGEPYFYYALESGAAGCLDSYSAADDEGVSTLTIRNTGEPLPLCRIEGEEFLTLAEALEYIKANDLYSVTVELLRDYDLPAADAMQVPKSVAVTLRTADGFVPSDGSARTVALLRRYDTFRDGAMIVNHGALYLENILLDGNSGVQATRAIIDSQGSALELCEGAVLQGARSSDLGGAVLLRSGSMTVSGGTICDNRAAYGGAICNAGNGTVNISGGAMRDNRAQSGGAVYSAGIGEVEVSGGSITGNIATAGDGGAIYAVGGTVTVSGGTLGGEAPTEGGAPDPANLAANGGAIASAGAQVVVTGGTVIGNRAQSGGAIYALTGAVTISGGALTENTATSGDGGALCARAGTVVLSGGSMTRNAAANGSGGAVYIGGSLTMTGGTLGADGAPNTARAGAALCIASGSAALSGGTITGNIAPEGGAVDAGGDGVRLTLSGGVRITGNYNASTADRKSANLCLSVDSDAVIHAGSFTAGGAVGVYVADAVRNARGIPGVYFASFDNAASDTAYCGVFTNDRYPGFEARADLTSKRLYWGMPLAVEVYQMDSYASALPPRSGDKQSSSKWYGTVYPRASSGAVSELAQSLYATYKARLGASSAFGAAFAYYGNASLDAATAFEDYLVSFRWDTEAGAWQFTKRDGSDTALRVLRVYYSNPAYISIENNTNLPGSTPSALTITDLTLNVGGRELSVKNHGGNTGYGYIVARNGGTSGALLPVSGGDLDGSGNLVLEPGGSIKLMFPGGCGAGYTLTGHFATDGYQTALVRTASAEGTYAEQKDYVLAAAPVTGSVLSAAGGTYEILFGGRKPVCRIVVPEADNERVTARIESVASSGALPYTSKSEIAGQPVEYLFAKISQAVSFVDAVLLPALEVEAKYLPASDIYTVTIEILQDYLLPGTDKVDIASSGVNYVFRTATDGTYHYLGEGNATISRDPGNPNSFIQAQKATSTTEETVYNLITVENLNFDGRNLAGSGDGGALMTQNWSVYIENADFRNFVAGNGGAVFVEFGSMETSGSSKDKYLFNHIDKANAVFTARRVSFENCHSISQKNRQGGGAIWTNARVMDLKGTETEHCTFNSCTAWDQGGAVFHRVDFYLTGSSVEMPAAVTDDGTALYTATEDYTGTVCKVAFCDFTGCEAGAAGALESDASIVKVYGCSFANCQATRRNGGGFNVFSNNASATKDLSLVWAMECSFQNCYANNVLEGTTYYGGCLRSAAKRTYIKGCSFENSASNCGGAVACSNGSGEVAVFLGVTIDNAQSSLEGGGIYSLSTQLTVGDYTTSHGKLIHSSITRCTSGKSGGGVYHFRVLSTCNASLTNCTVSNCRSLATEREAVIDDKGTIRYYGGGGLYVHSQNLILTGCTIQNNTATQNGGGVCASYNWTTLTIDDCVVTGNTAGGRGGGAFTEGAVVVRDGCYIMGNRLSHTNKSFAAGVWIQDGKTFRMEATVPDGVTRGTNTTRICENHSANGAPSNLRLPEANGNNRTDGVRVACNLAGQINVINAKSKGTQFGQATDGVVSPTGFMETNHVFTADDGSLYGILSRDQELEKATKLIWAGEPICKITDENGNLLYLVYNGSVVMPAVFDLLDKSGASDGSRISAFSLLRKANLKLYTDKGDVAQVDTYYVKMLVEEYSLVSPVSTAGIDRSIVLTTAKGAEGDGFPYRGDGGTRATVRRSAAIGDNPMLTVKNSELLLQNIILDGSRSEDDCVGENTQILLLSDENPHADMTLTLGTNARLVNAAVESDGAAALVNAGSLVIDGGVIQNCEAEGNGGAVYMDSADGTLTMSAGSIANCRAGLCGGGVCVGGGEFVMTGGSIERCGYRSDGTVTRKGGGIFAAAGQIARLSGTASVTANRAVESGGGIATGSGNDNTRLYFGGKVRVTGNMVGGVACNVELADDRNDLIHADGLRSGARIGVFVDGEMDNTKPAYADGLYSVHGDAEKPFATFTDGSPDEKYLHCFINDRNSLKGGVLPTGSEPGIAYWVKIFTLRVETNVLSDSEADQKDVFSYTVTLYKDEFGNRASDVNGWFGDEEEGTAMFFDRGVATFGLKNNEFREADGLASGMRYEVVQTLPAGKENYYTVSVENPAEAGMTEGVIGENNVPGNPNMYLSRVTFNNIHAICKITGQSSGLLYYRLGKKYQSAVYSELSRAFSDVTFKELYYQEFDGTFTRAYASEEFRVEMLVQSCSITAASGSGTATLGGENPIAARSVTLTTADPNATDGYRYTGGSETAVIRRAEGFDRSMLHVTENGTLTMGNIILDGNGSVQTASQYGSLIRVGGVDSAGAALTITEGTTLRNASSSNKGAAVYVFDGATVTMTGGTITGNVTTATVGAGVYLEEGATMYLSGSPDFGGADVYTDADDLPEGKRIGDVKGEQGNFTAWTLADAANGGRAYTRIRQDICIAGYADGDAVSLVLNGDLGSGDGTIWVLAEEDLHSRTQNQFAVCTDGVADRETTGRALRNALPDAMTGNPTGDYLYGVFAEDDSGNVLWNGLTGSRMVILRKTDNVYSTLPGATFTLYTGGMSVVRVDDAELRDMTSLASGVIWIGMLPYGVYYLVETSAPSGYAAGRFVLTVSADGVTCERE